MIRTGAVVAVFLAAVAVGVAYAAAFLPGGAPGWSAWLMVVATAAMLVATMALGATRAGSSRWLWASFAAVFVVLVAGFGLALALPPEGPGAPLFLGLPARAAIVLYGVGLLPLLAMPVAYALTFDESSVGEAELDRLRRAAREAVEAGKPEPCGRGRDDTTPAPEPRA